MTKRFISWGGGVQSTTMAVMSALGDLEPVDAVIFADTGWEREATYHSVRWYMGWLREHGVRVEIVSAGNIREDGVKEHIHIPFWTSNGGPLQRQCTKYFKVLPIRRKIRELLGFHPSRPPHPPAGAAELWLGISLDEYLRMKQSRVAYIRHRWPLVERRITRNDCIEYLKEHGLPVPPKSACVCCPYRIASEWLRMREEAPQEFAEAVAFDEAIRYLRPNGSVKAESLYIWKGLEPLAAADLETAAEKERRAKQLPLILTVCDSGHCWV